MQAQTKLDFGKPYKVKLSLKTDEILHTLILSETLALYKSFTYLLT